MNRRWSKLVVAFLVLTSMLVVKAAAQEAPQQKSDLEKRLEALEQKLDKLEKRLDAILPAASVSTPASTTDRMEAIDKKLQLLEHNDKQQSDALAKAKDAPVVSAGRDGFSIASADKAYRLRLGGYGQVDGKTFYDDSARVLINSFSVRRARLNIDGTVGRFIDFRIAPDFGNGSVSLFDAYADLKYQPYSVLRAGKFKAPIGLEALQNDTELSLIERSLVSDLVPNRDMGFQRPRRDRD